MKSNIYSHISLKNGYKDIFKRYFKSINSNSLINFNGGEIFLKMFNNIPSDRSVKFEKGDKI